MVGVGEEGDVLRRPNRLLSPMAPAPRSSITCAIGKEAIGMISEAWVQTSAVIYYLNPETSRPSRSSHGYRDTLCTIRLSR
jgi:hypothetical protein